MKLSEAQIQELYTFTQMHFVEWHDVKVELVDHLANGIEAQWEENPKLGFKEALDIEFKKFGVCGFSDVVEEKTKALNKHYRLLVWCYFKDFFKLPKIILTLFLIWTYYQLLVVFGSNFWLLLITCITLILIPFWFMFKQSQYLKSVQRKTGKKWLFDSTVTQLGDLIHIFNMGIYVSVFLDLEGRIFSFTSQLTLSLFVVLFSLVLYVSIFVVTPKLRKTMANQHPDYRIV